MIDTKRTELTPKQQDVLDKVLALRHLEILATLTAMELAEVGQQLMEHQQQHGW